VPRKIVELFVTSVRIEYAKIMLCIWKVQYFSVEDREACDVFGLSKKMYMFFVGLEGEVIF